MGCIGVTGKPKEKRQMRLILLGIAGSGKSTFVKQMQIIHKGGFDPVETETYKRILFLNIFNGIKLLAEIAMENILEENRKKARYILSLEENEIKWDEELIDKITALWDDPALQSAWANRKESLLVQLDYLMQNFKNYLSPDFTPSHEDILRARQRSTGENVSSFEDSSNVWNLVDLGGQMSERSKWESTFESQVNAVIFFIAMDEFDIINPESKTVEKYPTKLLLAISIMEEFFNGPLVAEARRKPSRIVFLNKSDLFRIKIEDDTRFSEFKKYMEYNGEAGFDKCAGFLEHKIQLSVKDTLPTHTHVVCALDTETMKKVTNDIKMTIVASSLQDMGIL